MVTGGAAREMRDRLDEALDTLPVVAILRGISPNEVGSISDALVDRGVRLIEVPLNSPDAWKSIECLVARHGDRALVGAGTVLKVADLERLRGIGAELVVTPNTDVSVVRAAARMPLISVIGCMSPTEALAAADEGATALKIFPAATLGASYLRELGAILPPAIPRLAVGGINGANARSFLREGAVGVGIGTALYRVGDDADRVRMKAEELNRKIKEMG